MYCNITLKYKIIKLDDKTWVWIEVTPTTGVLEIPDEYKGYPVTGVTFSDETPAKLIKEIIVGTNLQTISRFSKKLKELKMVVFKDGFDITKPGVNYFYKINSYSDYNVDILFETGKLYKKENGCLLTNDGKTLVYIIKDDGIVEIPNGVENIAANVLYGKSGLKIKFPDTIKHIDSKVFFEEMSSYNRKEVDEFLRNNHFPKSIEEVWESTYDRNNCSSEKNVAGIYGATLYFGPNVKAINIYYPYDKIYRELKLESKYLVYENGVILSKDKTRLESIPPLGEESIYIPATITQWNKFIVYPKELQIINVDEKTPVIDEIIAHLNKAKGGKPLKIVYKEVKEVKQENIADVIASYKVKGSKCWVDNAINTEVLNVNSNELAPTKNKEFVINSNLALVKEIIIPEGVNVVSLDPSCYEVKMNLEIISLPSTCNLTQIMQDLILLPSVMLVIIDGANCKRWTLHKLPYVVASKDKLPFKKTYKDWIEYPYCYDTCINEITRLEDFDRDKLVITDEAYYYFKTDKALKVLKVRYDHPNYQTPKKVNDIPVKGEYDFYFNKFEDESEPITNNNIQKPEANKSKEESSEFDDYPPVDEDAILG